MKVLQIGLGANIPYYLCYGLQQRGIQCSLILPRRASAPEIFYGLGSGNPLGVKIVRSNVSILLPYSDSLVKEILKESAEEIVIHTHIGRYTRILLLLKIIKALAENIRAKDFHIIWHFHGTDLRTMPNIHRSLFSRLNEYIKYLVSTPDLLIYSKGLGLRAEWLPNPVDPLLFESDFSYGYARDFIKNVLQFIKKKKSHYKILFVPTRQDEVKGVNTFLSFIKDFCKSAKEDILRSILFVVIRWGKLSDHFISTLKELGFKVLSLPILNREEYLHILRISDIVIGQFRLGSLGLTELEALSMGKPVIMGKLLPIVKHSYGMEVPVYEADYDNFSEIFEKALSEEDDSKLKEIRLTFVRNYHSIQKIMEIYLRYISKSQNLKEN